MRHGADTLHDVARGAGGEVDSHDKTPLKLMIDDYNRLLNWPSRII